MEEKTLCSNERRLVRGTPPRKTPASSRPSLLIQEGANALANKAEVGEQRYVFPIHNRYEFRALDFSGDGFRVG